MADHRRDRSPALFLHLSQQDVGQFILRPGERACDVIQHALPCQHARMVRQIGVAQRARLFGQCVGEAL